MVEQRVVGARGRTAVLADGTEVRTDAVLWCTGYRPALHWLRVPGALDEQGRPVHDAGRATVPGLHWVGLPWQTRLNSGIVDGVDRDARQAVRRIAADHPFGPGRTAMDDDALAARPAVSPPPDTDRAARPAPTAGEAA